MAKILLVEDDNNLREIYQARLTAEGYDIVAAQNGEDALVLAKQQHPDLVISDVMMPRISGYEMLDILRNTEGLKHTKVIMLTALGQNEDKERAGKLGADKYLVKSQVTLEDIVNSAKALLADDSVATPQVAAPDPTDPLGMSTTDQPDDTAAASVPSVAPTVAPLSPIPEPASVVAAPSEVAPEPVATEPAPAPVAIEPEVAPSVAPSPEQPATALVPEAAPPEATATPDAVEPVVTEPAAPTTDPVTVDALINEDPVATETVAEAVQADVGSAQSAVSEQALVDQQIASFSQPEVPPTEPAQVTPQVNPEQENNNDATLSDALQTLTSDTTADVTTPQPETSTITEAAETHGIEGLSGVNDVVEVPAEPHVDPTPSPTATVIQPVVAPPTPEAAQPIAPTPEPSSMAQTIEPTEAPQPPAVEQATVEENDGVNVVGKKVIQPLSDPNGKPDLDKLLAQEEAKQSDETPPKPVVGDAATPNPSTTPKPAGGFDPNSIAL